MNERYPRLEVNLEHLKHNVAKIVEKCGGYGIQVAGVIKGATGHPEVAKKFDEGGAEFFFCTCSKDNSIVDSFGRAFAKMLCWNQSAFGTWRQDCVETAERKCQGSFSKTIISVYIFVWVRENEAAW